MAKLRGDEMKLAPPLLYEWHEKQYLGAAHGMAGILFMLLQVYGELEMFYKYLNSSKRSTWMNLSLQYTWTSNRTYLSMYIQRLSSWLSCVCHPGITHRVSGKVPKTMFWFIGATVLPDGSICSLRHTKFDFDNQRFGWLKYRDRFSTIASSWKGFTRSEEWFGIEGCCLKVVDYAMGRRAVAMRSWLCTGTPMSLGICTWL